MELPVSMRRSPAGCLGRMLLPVMAKGKAVEVLPVSTQQAGRALGGVIVGAARGGWGGAGAGGRRGKAEGWSWKRIRTTTGCYATGTTESSRRIAGATEKARIAPGIRART